MISSRFYILKKNKGKITMTKQKTIVEQFNEMNVQSIIPTGFYISEDDDETKKHTDFTRSLFIEAVNQNLDVLKEEEDYISLLFVENNQLVIQIERHDLEKYPNGIEYRTFKE